MSSATKVTKFDIEWELKKEHIKKIREIVLNYVIGKSDYFSLSGSKLCEYPDDVIFTVFTIFIELIKNYDKLMLLAAPEPENLKREIDFINDNNYKLADDLIAKKPAQIVTLLNLLRNSYITINKRIGIFDDYIGK